MTLGAGGRSADQLNLFTGSADEALAAMGRGELLTQTAAVFGHKRRSAAVTGVLEQALTAAVDRGTLTEQPNGLLTV